MPTHLEKHLLKQWLSSCIELDPNSCEEIPDLYTYYCEEVSYLVDKMSSYKDIKTKPVPRKSFSAELKRHLSTEIGRSSVRFFYHYCSKVEGIRYNHLM